MSPIVDYLGFGVKWKNSYRTISRDAPGPEHVNYDSQDFCFLVISLIEAIVIVIEGLCFNLL